MPKLLYTPVYLAVDDILKDIRSGRIGLPDLQRPFVWPNNKIPKLLDSMLRGFPIGYIMLWEAPTDSDDKKSSIGTNDKAYASPKELVIDGQQRLTALLSSFYGISIKDKNYKDKVIRIAFDPIDRTFENANASTDKNPRYVSSISEVFSAKRENRLSSYRREFIRQLNEAKAKKKERELTGEEEDAIENGLNALLDLDGYMIPTLSINSDADEEMVAEIFVRVNSGGQTLKEKDFIMTLLSVYSPSMRDRIEQFCEDSRKPAQGTSYNPLTEVDPINIIRAAVIVGFKRGRLKYAYQILRGRDLKTGITSIETRVESLNAFGLALDMVLNLNNWHAYIQALGEAGFICREQISSDNALAFCYAFYLIGRYEFGIKPIAIRKLIRKWYFACSLTSLYAGSFETVLERQINDISAMKSPSEFEAYLERNIGALLTDDYFKITLPNDLNANEATGPTWQGFVAAQIILGAKSLFSTVPLSSLLTLGSSGTKKAVDKHHLFPDNYLKQIGQLDSRSNRANFTLVDYDNNIYISDEAPSAYVPTYKQEMGEQEYLRNCQEHALPVGFETMDYEEFLEQRRTLMASVIKRGFERLCGSEDWQKNAL